MPADEQLDQAFLIGRARLRQLQRVAVEFTLADGENGATTRRVETEDVENAVQLVLAQTGRGRILAVNTLRPTLEEVFIKLTGLSAEVMLVEKGGKGGGNAGG